MIKVTERGSINALFVPFILVAFLLIAALGFGIWAFSGRADYKNNVDTKVAAAVKTAEQTTSDAKEKEFSDKEKSPYKTYTGPSAYGSVKIDYPKTWSAYIDEGSKSATPLDGYFNPNFVPAGQAAQYAIRIVVSSGAYTSEIRQFDSLIKNGKVKVTPYRAPQPQVNSIIGIRIDGEIRNGVQGSMVILPVRDKTLKVWREGAQFADDYDKIVLPSLTFVP